MKKFDWKKVAFRVGRLLKYNGNAVYCELGERNNLGQKGIFLHEKAKIGNSNYIGERTKIVNAIIGNYNSIADDVKIGQMEHDIACISTSWRIMECLSDMTGWLMPCIIENDVWIASNAVIKQGVTVHTGAVVGAGAVVVEDVPPYAIVGGVPAKIIRYRFNEEQIKLLLESEWWKYPEAKAREICRVLTEEEKRIAIR